MKNFSVKNFERFQHYKDRAPPWIKLYNELLDDYQFGALPDASKMHLVAIWLLASRSANKIPYDPAWISKRINANSKVDLEVLLRAGFIVINQELRNVGQDASKMPAECLSREEGETEERRDREEEITASPPTEKKSRRKPMVAIPDGFCISASTDEYAKSLGFRESERKREHQKFIYHAKTNDRRCADWHAAEHNWFTKAADFAGKQDPMDKGIADDGMIEVLNDDQLAAWDAYGRKKSGKPFPRNRRGGWRFPSKWPPGHETKIFDDVQKLVEMGNTV